MPKIHDTGSPKKALLHGHREGFGPMLNVRHPKKCPPLMKKTAPSAANTESGKKTPHDH